MEIIKFKENQKNEWNEFVIRNGGSFLQSYEWGEFQKSLGRKVWRFSNGKFQALIMRHKLPFGKSYLYCPRPTLTFSVMTENVRVLEEVKELAKKENAIFLRIDPEWNNTEENRNILEEAGFQKTSREIQPKRTLILDIMRPGEELLAQIHQKTRYNIKLAEKHGIKINISNKQEYFEDFWRLMQETAKRDKFQPHQKEYYRKMLDMSIAKLFAAEYKKKIIAANIVVFFGGRATYLHGASDYKHRNLMAPHLLQWEQIKEAKKLDCREYDFWGIDEKKWPGITRFKKGFACPLKFSGGKFEWGDGETGYVGAWDFVLDKKLYAGYNMLTKIRSLVK